MGALDQSTTESESISLTAPSTPGTYYYGACVDSVSGESNTANNCSSGKEAIVQSVGNSDIVVGSFSVRDTEVGPGESVRLTVTVRNDGTGRSGGFILSYYLSTNSTISSSDTEVGRDGVQQLNSGQTSPRETITVNAPSVSGTYYYGVCFGTIAGESNTANNCSSGVSVTVS